MASHVVEEILEEVSFKSAVWILITIMKTNARTSSLKTVALSSFCHPESRLSFTNRMCVSRCLDLQTARYLNFKPNFHRNTFFWTKVFSSSEPRWLPPVYRPRTASRLVALRTRTNNQEQNMKMTWRGRCGGDCILTLLLLFFLFSRSFMKHESHFFVFSSAPFLCRVFFKCKSSFSQQPTNQFSRGLWCH